MSSILSKNKGIIYPVILMAASLLFLFLTLSFVSADKSGLFISDAAHLYNASCLQLNLRDGDSASFILSREMYPNLFHQLIALLSFLMGDMTRAAALLNALSVLVMTAGVYHLGTYLWNEDTGFLAAVIIPGFAGVARYSLINNIDLPGAALIPWAFLLLIRSEGFKNRGYSIAFYLVFAAGMLIKWMFKFFLVIPFMIIAIRTVIEAYKTNKKRTIISLVTVAFAYPLILFGVGFLGKDSLSFPPQDGFFVFYVIFAIIGLAAFLGVLLRFKSAGEALANMIAGFILVTVLTGHYYLYSFQYLLHTYLGRFLGGPEVQIHAPTHNPYYFLVKFFTLEFTGISVFVIILAGIGYYLFRGEKNRDRNLLLWGALTGLVILAAQPVYDPRYFLFLAGILAPFGVFWITEIKWPAVKAAILIPLLTVTFLTWAGWAVLPGTVDKIFPGVEITRPDPVDWKIREAVNGAWDDFRKPPSRGKPLFVFLDDSGAAGVKPLVLMYYLSCRMDPGEKIYIFPEGVNLRKAHPGESMAYFVAGESRDGEETDENLSADAIKPGAVYFVCFTGGNGTVEIPAEIPAGFPGSWKDGMDKRKKIGEIPLPGKGRIVIYRW